LKSIDTLVSDIESLFEGAIFTSDNLLAFSTEINRVLVERFERYGQQDKRGLYLSNVGRPLRQLWFELKSGLKGEPFSPSTKMKLLYGHIIEAFTLLLVKEAGHEVTELQQKVEVDGIRGRIDCRIDDYLVDIKSCSSRSFEKFKNGRLRNDDPFGYIGQLCGYAHGSGVNAAAFLAIDKQFGHLCLLKLTPEEIQAYDVRSKISAAKEVLSRDIPPKDYCYPDQPDGVSKTAPFGNGNRILGTNCSYCDHKFNCRPGIRQFIYSSGPKYFTHIEPNKAPSVFEVKRDNNP